MTKPKHGRRAASPKPLGSAFRSTPSAVSRAARRAADAVRPAAERLGLAFRPAAVAVHTAGSHAFGRAQHAFDRLPNDAARVGVAVLAMTMAGAFAIAANVPALAVTATTADEGAPVASVYEEPAPDRLTVAPQTVVVPAEVQTQAAMLTPESYSVEAAPPPIASSVAGLGVISLGQARGIVWPVVDPSRTSDGFGPRSAPCAGCSTSHDGVDFTSGEGTPIMSIADGVVVLATENGGGLGVNVEVQHNIDGQLITSSYAHMQFGSLQVVVGQQVSAGQQLGRLGTTGQSTGPHLHLEMFGADGVRFDGMAWLHSRLG
ncbi:M23 family metallopeptidase [Agromyces sp. MMS24-JH15]|uniref:M23 family metallopeptidase n=1 Tax=Agromyces sp. MMS24-JH15 TaxID=3243765 RepID=UPI003749A4D0